MTVPAVCILRSIKFVSGIHNSKKIVLLRNYNPLHHLFKLQHYKTSRFK